MGRLKAFLSSFAAAVAGCASGPTIGPVLPAAMSSMENPPQSRDCPDAVGVPARCYGGRDRNGAHYLVAIPETWNKRLIVFAHGGPRLDPPEADGPAEDLTRFAVVVRAGYAWIGSTYRRGGYGVRMAAADVEESRKIFWGAFGRPARTILHGQSWGGNVAAKAAELYTLDEEGARIYDGAMLTSGVLAGGTRAYGFRADLRAVYQYYCRNHPAAGEPQYPLWQGLPLDSRLNRRDLEARVNACTGLNLPAAQRTSEQAEKLRNILAVTGISEGELVSHMGWSTFTLQDLVQKRLGGLNPFDNTKTYYRGSTDDAALNREIVRFAADQRGLAQLAFDSDLSGLIAAPTVTMHAMHDPTIPFSQEAIYTQTVAGAGRQDLLVQTATDEAAHSKLAEVEYVSLLSALDAWIERGERPTQQSIAATCATLQSTYSGGCHFVSAPASAK